METTPENIKKPRYWFELPLEIGRAVLNELLLEVELALGETGGDK